MDPCTQGLLGASLASSFSKKENVKYACFCGSVGGLVPDLDVLIRSSYDSLLSVEFHRHFTHSLIFVPFLSLVVTFLLHFFIEKKVPLKQIYLFSTLGVFTHGLLDACTSYGTSILWPFYNDRVSLNIISIVDPIYTVILLVFLISSLIKKSPYLSRIAIVVTSSYLLFGFFQYKKLESFIINTAMNRGHNIERILLNPTIGNNILWRTIYQSKGFYYIGAAHLPVFSRITYKDGAKIKVINENQVFPEIEKNSVQRDDIKRFSHFSQGFIYIHPDYENVIADLRYGTLPYDYKSMWGIEVDKNNLNQHVKFKNLRNFTDQHYEEFWDLLNGNLQN